MENFETQKNHFYFSIILRLNLWFIVVHITSHLFYIEANHDASISLLQLEWKGKPRTIVQYYLFLVFFYIAQPQILSHPIAFPLRLHNMYMSEKKYSKIEAKCCFRRFYIQQNNAISLAAIAKIVKPWYRKVMCCA